MSPLDDYLQQARSGDVESAFHNLLELDPSALPALQQAYFLEEDPVVRSLLVEVIWQHREPSVVGFLANALNDPAPDVWKEALDGLVTLASPESLQRLQSAARSQRDPERQAWIEEAIEQSISANNPPKDQSSLQSHQP